jgi:hypothetical protein
MSAWHVAAGATWTNQVMTHINCCHVTCWVGFKNRVGQSDFDTCQVCHESGPLPKELPRVFWEPTHPPTTHHPPTSSLGVLASSGCFWEVPRVFGKFWDVFRSFGVFSEVPRAFWDVPGRFGKFLRCIGKFQDVLDSYPGVSLNSRTFWEVPGCFGKSRDFGKFRDVLGSSQGVLRSFPLSRTIFFQFQNESSMTEKTLDPALDQSGVSILPVRLYDWCFVFFPILYYEKGLILMNKGNLLSPPGDRQVTSASMPPSLVAAIRLPLFHQKSPVPSDQKPNPLRPSDQNLPLGPYVSTPEGIKNASLQT